MASSQDRRAFWRSHVVIRATGDVVEREPIPFTPKPAGKRTTPRKRCQVPIALPGLPIPVACGDPVKKAGRCVEHLADWKHAKESRRGQPATVTAHRDPRKNHGTGKSASAQANREARAGRRQGKEAR